MKIGFIGLGNLGTPIAENLLSSGHELVVYNRTASKAKPLADKGATIAPSIEALAKACTVVCTMVADDAALTSISAGKQGLLMNLTPGSIHISMSTILPATAAELSREHAASGQHYVAAPVFGRPEAARARKLNFVISGADSDIRNRVTPILKDSGGAGVWDFGDAVTAANTIKLCGNFTIAAALAAIGESIQLAQRSGIDAGKMWELFTQTMHNSPLYHTYSKIIAEEKFEPAAFTAKLGLKDMNLVLQQASETGAQMPLAALLQQKLQQLVNSGKENIDWSAIGAE